jgi:hypothetical protein
MRPVLVGSGRAKQDVLPEDSTKTELVKIEVAVNLYKAMY